jgi:hypothetical protein
MLIGMRQSAEEALREKQIKQAGRIQATPMTHGNDKCDRILIGASGSCLLCFAKLELLQASKRIQW